MKAQNLRWIIPPGVLLAAVLVSACTNSDDPASVDTVSEADLDRIGHRIWQNECKGSLDGLTSWEISTSVECASLGIGHFIWYPPGRKGPFEESFPMLVRWLQREGVSLPNWLVVAKGCPWPDKEAFERAHDSAEQEDLRRLLSTALPQQVRFIIHRLNEALLKYRAVAGGAKDRVKKNVNLLKQTAAGNFAMIDYVNFKGEGLNPNERYNGEGWGLLQVLLEMKADDAGSAPAAFRDAAKRVLARRVKNSPPDRGEKVWLLGWGNRCDAYAE
jgi:hypothetical protein